MVLGASAGTAVAGGSKARRCRRGDSLERLGPARFYVRFHLAMKASGCWRRRCSKAFIFQPPLRSSFYIPSRRASASASAVANEEVSLCRERFFFSAAASFSAAAGRTRRNHDRLGTPFRIFRKPTAERKGLVREEDRVQSVLFPTRFPGKRSRNGTVEIAAPSGLSHLPRGNSRKASTKKMHLFKWNVNHYDRLIRR